MLPWAPPRRRLWGATATIANDTAPDLSRCSRGQAGTWLVAEDEPLCRTIDSECEV
jgi:hypothetical protein